MTVRDLYLRLDSPLIVYAKEKPLILREIETIDDSLCSYFVVSLSVSKYEGRNCVVAIAKKMK